MCISNDPFEYGIFITYQVWRHTSTHNVSIQQKHAIMKYCTIYPVVFDIETFSCEKPSKQNPIPKQIECNANERPWSKRNFGTHKYNTPVIKSRGTDMNITKITI